MLLDPTELRVGVELPRLGKEKLRLGDLAHHDGAIVHPAQRQIGHLAALADVELASLEQDRRRGRPRLREQEPLGAGDHRGREGLDDNLPAVDAGIILEAEEELRPRHRF